MEDDLGHEKDMQSPIDLDLHLEFHQARDQSEHTPMNVKVWCAGNHFPKELQPAFLQQDDEVLLNELLVHDRA
jgi:hypothetical protein